MSNISQKLINAMGVIAEDAVKKAGYDKTIQVQILSCQDQAQGKYRCRYQDAIFYAYSNNPQVSYSNGSHVYVLVPGNDMSKKKNIVGSTQDLGLNYATNFEAEDFLEKVGINCVTSNNTYYLDSNNIDYSYDLYKSNKIILDSQSLNTYIKESSYLILSATITTNLDVERQYSGHYGIIFKLVFKDNDSGNEVIRTFTLDQDNMVGNPYKLQQVRQYQTFPIDSKNFIRIQGIEIFNNEFLNANGTIRTGQLNSGDIEFSNIEIQAANKISQEDLNGVIITFFTPDGTFFNNNSLQGSSKQITAQVRIKGKILNDSSKIPFYWGIENIGITPNNPSYNKNLGRGWKCLNEYTTITQQEKESGVVTKQKVIQWVPATDTYYFSLDEATAKNNIIKVAVIYEGSILHKEINIQNLSSNIPDITIQSSDGKEFFLDSGEPTLICKVNNEDLPNRYNYKWASISNKGTFTTLLESGTYNYIQRINKNRIQHFQIKAITDFVILKCSVYSGQVYIGTGSIRLLNSLKNKENSYNLIIENGTMVFKYDSNGTAPNSESLINPIQLKALSFRLYDGNGKRISNDKIINSSGTEIKWEVPIKNTMLKVSTSTNGGYQLNPEDDTTVFFNGGSQGKQRVQNLIYQIVPKYNVNNQNNQIKLHLKYQNIKLVATTHFSFIKQGQDGTNGSQYYLKLIPNTNSNIYPSIPVFTRYGTKNEVQVNFNLGTSESNIIKKNLRTERSLLKAQLWDGNELILTAINDDSNFVFSNDYPNKTFKIKWQILSNKYGTDKSDNTIITFQSEKGAYITLEQKFFDTITNNSNISSIANIVKCSLTYQGKTYYATLPIITKWLQNNTYELQLKENTGFNYVIYSSDGMKPKYNNSFPFQFILKDGTINTLNSNYTYDIYTYGDTKVKRNNNWINVASNQLIQIERKNTDGTLKLAKNQFDFKPSISYDGLCVNNGLICICKKSGSIIGKIYIPIHFYLNKFAFSELNGWDGNSIQINEQGGFILSPQMGAGIKDSNNRFTGVVMGEERDPSKDKSNIGLLGYNKGTRSFFINSENGSALFGKTGTAQIVIDPTANMALLYSHDYWKEYNQNTGLPVNYRSENENNEGMLINLNKPWMGYGNGNFRVSEEGYLYAKNGGTIGGWKITKTEDTGMNILYGASYDQQGNLDNSMTLASSGRLWTGKHNGINSTKEGVFISESGISIGSKFKVGADGYLRIGHGAVTAESGKKYWTINGAGETEESHIYYGKRGSSNSVYIGTDEISLGSKFVVTNDGVLRVGRGAVANNSGSQRFWTIDGSSSDSYIKYNNKADSNSVYIGTDGIWLGNKFSVTNDGTMTMKKGSLTIGNNFEVDSSGNLRAKNVNISGLQATNATLSGTIRSQKTDSTGYIEMKAGVLRGGWGSNHHGSIDFTYTTSGTYSDQINITAPTIKFNASDRIVIANSLNQGGTYGDSGTGRGGLTVEKGFVTSLGWSGPNGTLHLAGSNGYGDVTLQIEDGLITWWS